MGNIPYREIQFLPSAVRQNCCAQRTHELHEILRRNIDFRLKMFTNHARHGLEPQDAADQVNSGSI